MKDYILFLGIILFTCNLSAKEHYTITEDKEDKLVGKTLNFDKPVTYIKGLKHCNDLNKDLAINSICLISKKAKYKLTTLDKKSKFCFLQPKNKHQLRTVIKDNSTFKVINKYHSEFNSFSYKILGQGVGKIVLLKDNKGNYVEANYEDLKSLSYKINDKEKKLLSIRENENIEKRFCFRAKNIGQFNNTLNYIKELKLDISIEPTQCDNFGVRKGFILKTNNFDDFHTFDFFREDYNIHGRWF